MSNDGIAALMSGDRTDEKFDLLHDDGEMVVRIDGTEPATEANRFRRAIKYSQSFYKSKSFAARKEGREEGSQSEAAELLAEDRCEGMEYEDFRTDFPGMHEAIQDAVTGAVQDVMQDAVTEAVQAAVDEGMKFDVRANLYTIIAITGVVLYWRGIWTTWDYFFGFTIWSELGAILTGLGIMIAFRLFKMPLLDGLPSG